MKDQIEIDCNYKINMKQFVELIMNKTEPDNLIQ